MHDLVSVEAILIEHKGKLRKQFHVQRIGIFGSYARGHDGPLSDVDLLVELDRPVGWEIVDLHRYLEDILGMKVDLVTKGAVARKPLLWQSIQKDLVYV
jgi:predicted nucleotidyltransferase